MDGAHASIPRAAQLACECRTRMSVQVVIQLLHANEQQAQHCAHPPALPADDAAARAVRIAASAIIQRHATTDVQTEPMRVMASATLATDPTGVHATPVQHRGWF